MSTKKRRRSCRIPSTVWDNVLKRWTDFVMFEFQHGIETLHNQQHMKEYRFNIEETFVSITEMKVGGENSDVYFVKLYGKIVQPTWTKRDGFFEMYLNSQLAPGKYRFRVGEDETKEWSTQDGQTFITPMKYSNIFLCDYEGILKQFKPQHADSDVDPILEAAMQRYAHLNGLAPKVLASSRVAMISEQCSPHNNVAEKCYTNVYGLPVQLKRTANLLQTALSPGSIEILTLCQQMYADIGMFNMDPNDGNYMIVNEKLVQIDYGANRFHSEAAFEKFYNQIDSFYNKDLARSTLVVDKCVYPPSYYWYLHLFAPVLDTYEKSKLNKSEWDTFMVKLAEKREIVCEQLQHKFQKMKEKSAKKITTVCSIHTYITTDLI